MNQISLNITADPAAGPVSLAPLTPTIGAVVEDIDLARPLDPATLAGVRQALLDWKVLFFRDQRITTEQHLAFARNFGELEIHPFAPHKPCVPEVQRVTIIEDPPV